MDFDDFLSVFEIGEDLPQTDWRLAWDLVLIRLIDRLHEQGWIRQSAEAAEDLTELETRLAAEAEDSEELPAGAAG